MIATVADVRWLLLDFDGPVCSAFAGYPAPVIAWELATIAVEMGVLLPSDPTDPHKVLRTVHAQSPAAARQVELALQAAELEAVDSATPTPGAIELMERCAVTNRPVAIVSNNHGPAVHRYLDLHGLATYVVHVSGRNPDNVDLMKPNPHLLFEAMSATSAAPSRTGFVGDSLSDMAAGRAAAVIPIGFANKSGKAEKLAEAGADLVVKSMAELASML